jgi:hypothetical protein
LTPYPAPHLDWKGRNPPRCVNHELREKTNECIDSRDIFKAIGIGIATALILSAMLITAMKVGVSPMPKPVSLAFAERLLGRDLPLPVGLAFHVAWVTLFSVVYVAMFRHTMTFLRALGLAAVLWLVQQLLFFPFIGWGFFGLAIGPQLAIGSAVPHVMFAVILYALCRLSFHDENSALRRAHQ